MFSLYHGDNLAVYWIQEKNYTWRFPCSPFTTEIILLYTGYTIKELGGELYLEVSLFSLYHGDNLTVQGRNWEKQEENRNDPEPDLNRCFNSIYVLFLFFSCFSKEKDRSSNCELESASSIRSAKELSLCHKLKYLNLNIFRTRCCKPLIFQTQTI